MANVIILFDCLVPHDSVHVYLYYYCSLGPLTPVQIRPAARSICFQLSRRASPTEPSA